MKDSIFFDLDGTLIDPKIGITRSIRFALEETGAAAAPAMIGDRQEDILGALCNNMRAIGVTRGYGSRQKLRNAGAREFADRPEDLLPLLM